MLSEIQLPDESCILYISDLIPGKAWVHTALSLGYDRYPELAMNEKKEILEYLLLKNGTLFFTHDETTSHGKVHKNEQGRFYVS